MEQKNIDIKSLTLSKMREFFESISEKSYHADQVFRWLYVQKVNSFDKMTNISKSLRTKLKEISYLKELKIDKIEQSIDGTEKIRYNLYDGKQIESVLIPSKDHITICISSQVGCALNCSFCYTGTMGYVRNLSASEIVDQVLQAIKLDRHLRISNIVFMGMGEPLNNYDNVVDACSILMSDYGLNFSKRKITISTAGVVPKIPSIKEATGVRLAISINATTDEIRSKIMPINKKWNINSLITTLENLKLEQRERITFEYVLIKDLNDSIEDAKRLRKLLLSIPSKINIIPFNEHPASPYKTPSEDTIENFHTFLYKKGENVLLRRSRGEDISAACGQLVIKG